MLQRAASNAYSWWWASHIRTTQSKWLDTKLHEMEVRVKAMIKLIEIDADSFAKKAELYFKSRPELIEHVEETFRSYQALADRYDRISGELHKANHTIAAAFPDQVQLSMQEEDDDGFPKAITGIDLSHFQPQQMGARQMDSQNVRRGSSPFPRRTKGHVRISSHMSKEKAQEEIERLQKKILVLQTEKEFVKSSYETALAKYRDIERQATEMQEEVCSLQDDFSTSAIIEDNEARALMAARAIISCEDTLVSLQDEQKRSFKEARTEFQRIKEAKQKLNAFKSQCGQTHTEKEQCDHLDRELSSLPSEEDDDSVLKEGKLELQEVCQKVKEQFESHSESSVVELAEKVDELVEKVINLELAASSQNAQIDRMKTEADELHKRLNSLEEDKAALVGDSNKPAERLRQAEEVLQTAQRIESSVRHENGNIHKQLTEACNDLTDFMEKLDDPKPHGSELVVDSSRGSEGITSEEVTKGTASKPGTLPKRLQDNSGTSKSVNKESSDSLYDSSNEMATQDEESEGPMVWQQLVLNGLDGKDKILLKEYTSMLHNYKDTTKKLSEIEKKNQEYHLEAMSDVKDLKSANAKKDNEIHNLRRMLSSLQAKLNASLVQNDEKSEESSKTSTTPIPEDIDMAEIEEYIKQCSVEEPHASSVIEEKVRAEIDRVLEENLDFWLRFSTSYHQIQKFQEAFDKQKTEMDKLTDAKVQECSDTTSSNQLVTKQESAALEKKFRDLNTGLQVWLEKNVLLKGELESKFSSLCSIQEEISKVTTLGRTDGVHFTPFQAAKFQGEVLNLKQENKKVAKELQAGLDHVRGLQVEVGRAILKLRENPELSIVRCNRAQQNFKTLSTKAAIPLRTFLFGTKQKKTSLFSCMGPVVPKQYTDMRPGLFR